MTETRTGRTAFGDVLMKLMRDAGYTQQRQLAESSGISPATISRLVNTDEFTPDMRTLERLAEALGVPPLTLVAARAGARIQVGAVTPIVAELAQMLAEDSPMPVADRENLGRMLEMLAAAHRHHMVRRPATDDDRPATRPVA